MEIDPPLHHLLGGMEMPTEEQQEEIFQWLPEVEQLDEIGRWCALGRVLSAVADFRVMLRYDTDRWYTRKHLEETRRQLGGLGRAARALQAEIENLNQHARLELDQGIDINRLMEFSPEQFAIAVSLHFRTGRTREDALDPGIPFLEGSFGDRLANLGRNTVDRAERAIDRLQAPRKRGAPRNLAALALADRLADFWKAYSDRSLAPRDSRSRDSDPDRPWPFLHFVQAAARLVDSNFKAAWAVRQVYLRRLASETGEPPVRK